MHRAARLGGIITAVMVVASIASTPLLNDQLYHGDMWFVAALAIGLVGFYAMHLTRGTLAGQGRFRAYGLLIGAEGVIRLVGGIGLASLGVDRAGGYAMVLALAPFLAVAIALLAPEGPAAARAGGALQRVVEVARLAAPRPRCSPSCSPTPSLLGINILSSPIGEGHRRRVRVRVLHRPRPGARVPGRPGHPAAQARRPRRRRPPRRVPEGRGQAAGGGGRHRGDRHRSPAAVLGPTVGKILFSDFALSAEGLALLAAGSGLFIIALTIAQALMALGGHRFQALAWGLGLIVCVAVMLAVSGLELRVELGFVLGAAVAAVAMGAFTWTRMSRAGDSSLESSSRPSSTSRSRSRPLRTGFAGSIGGPIRPGLT